MNSTINGERLKVLIKKNNYTQEQFANEVGISLTNLKEYLNGKKSEVSPPFDVLLKMSELLNVSIGYITGTDFFPFEKTNSLYGFIKNSQGFHIECNPENEDLVYIKYKDFELYTDMNSLEEKVRETIFYQMFLENLK